MRYSILEGYTEYNIKMILHEKYFGIEKKVIICLHG